MNYKRVLSGVILFPIMAIIFIFGNTYFVDTLISIIAIMGLYEYYNAFKTKNKPVAVIGYIAAAMLAIIHVIPIDIALKVIAAIIPISILILFLKVIFSNMKTNISDEELVNAKALVKTSLNMTNDNIGRIVDNAYYQNISDLDELDVRLDKFDKVSINDVKKVAEKTSISTIYVLEGGSTNE